MSWRRRPLEPNELGAAILLVVVMFVLGMVTILAADMLFRAAEPRPASLGCRPYPSRDGGFVLPCRPKALRVDSRGAGPHGRRQPVDS
jgi:hypothetical protein